MSSVGEDDDEGTSWISSWAGRQSQLGVALSNWVHTGTRERGEGGGKLGTCILHSYLCKSLSKHMGLIVTLITGGSGCSVCLKNASPKSQNSN